MRAAAFSFVALLAIASTLLAQAPAPVVVPAMTPAALVAPAPASEPADSFSVALKALQEMRAANEETIRKQAAMLQQLDELEKAAAEIRLYTKRS